MKINLPIRCRSHYSILQSVLKPQDIVDYAVANNSTHACMIDYNNLSGAIEFWSKCQSSNIIPVIGAEIPLLGTKDLGTTTLIAKNLDGYKSLLNITYESNLNGIALEDISKFDLDSLLVCEGYKNGLQISCPNKFVIDQDVTLYKGEEDVIKLQIINALENKTKIDNIELKPGLSATEKFVDSSFLDHIEPFKLSSKPRLPDFAGKTNNVELFTESVYNGLTRIGKQNDQRYVERIKQELKVLNDAGLANYFLILQDIVEYARKSSSLNIGPGRGSAAGCLTSYCLNITGIDPLKHDLIFERFYNAGRNTEDHISMPDIDIDFATEIREDVISYIEKKYSQEKVAHIATYQTLMGRAAISAVLRTSTDMQFQEIKAITKNIEDKAKIADELEKMENPSVIQWALENKANKLKEWCELKDGKLVGSLANEFDLAMKLESLKSSLSKHAAGIVIGPERLETFLPMVWDTKDKQMIIGPEMNEVELAGGVKLDCLGLATLSKIKEAITSHETRINNEQEQHFSL